ncbi:MAG TPA: hypothetical protein VJY33_13050 [Isosphaeraceae bacterium]|nr:hypothetical protein [Isosphaeraceae bacterium]
MRRGIECYHIDASGTGPSASLYMAGGGLRSGTVFLIDLEAPRPKPVVQNRR